LPLRNADDVHAAVAGRELHQAEPVAARLQPHRLGVDGHEIAIGREVAEIAVMNTDVGQFSLPSPERTAKLICIVRSLSSFMLR
jgi:hypothetical protein